LHTPIKRADHCGSHRLRSDFGSPPAPGHETTIARRRGVGQTLGMAYLKPPWFTATIFNKLAMSDHPVFTLTPA